MIRKLWSPHNFKNCVGPHAFVDAVRVFFHYYHMTEYITIIILLMMIYLRVVFFRSLM